MIGLLRVCDFDSLENDCCHMKVYVGILQQLAECQNHTCIAVNLCKGFLARPTSHGRPKRRREKVPVDVKRYIIIVDFLKSRSVLLKY